MRPIPETPPGTRRPRLLARLRQRGVLRVAASYAVIAWLVIQIASVVFDPLGVPKWALTGLIIVAATGFPAATVLAWFLGADAARVESDAGSDGVAHPTARGLRHYADAIVIGILLVTVVVLAVKQSDLGRPKPPANPAIAVLPFANLSGDPNQEYFSDGLAEETLDRLGRVPGLRVIARSSSFRFKGQEQDIKTIAETLGVTTILEGSVRRDGRHLRLSARLIDGATGQETWSGSFDRQMTDVFKVQEELARAVVDAILPAAKGEQVKLDPVPQADLSAYDLYLLAKQSQWQRTPEAVKRAVSLLERSIALDPDYAPAHAQLSLALIIAWAYSDVDAADAWQRSRSEAHLAVSLDPDLPESQLAMAHAAPAGKATWHDDKLAMYKRVVERFPNYATAVHEYAKYLGGGTTREGQRWLARTLELDPLALSPRANLIIDLHQLGEDRRRDQELATYERLFARDPEALASLARVFVRMLNDPARAIEAARRSIQLSPPSPTPDAAIMLHRALLCIGAFGEAGQLLEKADWRTTAPATLAYEQALAAASRPDLAGLDAAIAAVKSLPSDATQAAALTYYLTLAGRFAEAAALSDVDWGPAGNRTYTLAGLESEQADIAAIWSLQTVGRRDEATKYIDEWLHDSRQAVTELPLNVPAWMNLAALESIRGHDESAVAALERAFARCPLPRFFLPHLPWFARLAGRPDYDRLVASWKTAQAAARTQALADGATAPP